MNEFASPMSIQFPKACNNIFLGSFCARRMPLSSDLKNSSFQVFVVFTAFLPPFDITSVDFVSFGSLVVFSDYSAG